MTSAEALQVQTNYHRLQESLALLERLVASPVYQPRWLDDLRRQLAAFEDEVRAHYELLDLGDYLGEVEQLAPQMHDRLMALQREQDLILSEVAQVRTEVEAARATLPVQTVPRLRLLLMHISDHETRKNLLVFDAFNVEPAAMD